MLFHVHLKKLVMVAKRLLIYFLPLDVFKSWLKAWIWPF